MCYDSENLLSYDISAVNTHGTEVTDYSIEHPDLIVHGPKRLKPEDVDLEQYIPHFCFAPLETIKKTFSATTQFGRMPMSTTFKKLFKSLNPALNTLRRNEKVGGDRIASDTPAIDGGFKHAAFFVGSDSHVADAYPLKSEKETEFAGRFQENITKRGAPDMFVSDRGTVEIGSRMKDMLRSLFINSWQSEPKHQHQNFTERRYQNVKAKVNLCMDRSGSPANTWFLCLLWVLFVMNHTWNDTIKGIPMQRATGKTMDISPILRFRWWEVVYYMVEDSPYPSESKEARGHFVRISENVGHTMTYKILTDDTKKIIHRSIVRSAYPDQKPSAALKFACRSY